MIFKNKSVLEMNLGSFIIEELYGANEYDLIDCFSVIQRFVPANYIVSRECYVYGYM